MGKTIKKVHPKKKKRVQNPMITKWQAKNKNYIGYCHNGNHKGYMTIECVCAHECLQKNCLYLEKCFDHNFWWDESYTTNKISYKKLSKMKQFVNYNTVREDKNNETTNENMSRNG